QRRTPDPSKRREIIYDIQRHLAQQQYYVQMPSAIYVAVWEGALKNYGPNMGYDYGGRLMAAWLHRGEAARLPPSASRSAASAQGLSRQASPRRGPVAPDRVADRLRPAAIDSRRRGGPDAGREGLREGHRRAARQARPRPSAAGPVLRVAREGGARRPGR